MKYSNLNLGQIEALVNNIGGMDAVERILAGKATVKVALIHKLMKAKTFPVYREIEVGGKSKDELFTKFEVNNMVATRSDYDIMSQDAWKPGKKEIIRFARVRVRDLGFTEKPTIADIWARIKQLGHSLCEPCDGPAIRLALKDPSERGVCLIAMKQITDSHGSPYVFGLGSFRSKCQLYSHWLASGVEWDLDSTNELVFRLGK